MKVLIFSPEKPYTGAESIVTGKLMLAMMKRGWEVDLIFHEKELLYTSSSDPLGLLNNSFGISNDRLRRFIKLFKIIPGLNKLYLFESFFWVITATFLAFKLNRSKKYDLVLSRIMPSYGHLPAYFFTRFIKIKWIANWSDPLPHIKAPVPYGIGLGAKINRIEMAYLKVIVKSASWHTFPNHRLMNYFQNYLPDLVARNSVLPHIVLNTVPEQINTNGKNNCITITHVGSFGPRNPINLILAIRDLISQRVELNIKFRLIGLIDDYIEDLIQNSELGHIFKLEGVKTYEQTLRAIVESDILLVVEAPLKEGIFLPSKIMDYLQFNKPILSISPAEGVMKDLLHKFGGGRHADCTSKEDIKSLMISIKGDFNSIINCKDQYNTSMLKAQFSEDSVISELIKLTQAIT